MQSLLYVYYSLRSVLLRGLLNSLKLLKGEISNERKFGIHTASIKKSESKEFFHYQGAGYIILFRIFKIIETYSKYKFVDIGCGKGRAVFVAERSGFKSLTGFDLDEQLIEIAQKNLDEFYRRRKDSKINFLVANALDYNYESNPTVYFLFNPFNEEVLQKVLERILAQNTEEAIFIYMNPLYPKPFFTKDFQLLHTIKTRFYTEALIFKKVRNQIAS